VWDRVEQIGPLGALVSGLLKDNADECPHPQSVPVGRVDPELLAKELEEAGRVVVPGIKLGDAARLRERVQAIIDRAAWVTDAPARQHLLRTAAGLMEKLG
jgi:MoxR-like ATPase